MRTASLALLLVACAHDPSTAELDLGLATSAGEPVDLDDYRGQVLLLDVWATWCRACRTSLPLYRTLYDELRERGFVVLAVSVDADADALGAYLSELDLPFPVVRDPGGAVPRMLGVKALPTSFLFDRNGALRWSRSGFLAADLWELRDWSLALLSEPEPPIQ